MLMTSIGWGLGGIINEVVERRNDKGALIESMIPITAVEGFTYAQMVELSNHFVSTDQANQNTLAAKCQTDATPDSSTLMLWLILPISLLIAILGYCSFKSTQNDLQENPG